MLSLVRRNFAESLRAWMGDFLGSPSVSAQGVGRSTSINTVPAAVTLSSTIPTRFLAYTIVCNAALFQANMVNFGRESSILKGF